MSLSVASVPAGISCGADCAETYALNTVVSLTAVPAAGFTFMTWGGDCTAGTVAWGHNVFGQLGDATTTQCNRPVQVLGRNLN